MTDRLTGYVPLYRKLFRSTHWLAPTKRYPAGRREAWLDLVQLAQHDDFKHVGVELARGEFVASVRWLADRWCWSRSATARYMLRLESETMIGTVRETATGTVYRIVNYDSYAAPRDTDRDTNRDRQRDATGTPPGHLRDKNNKREERNTLPHAHAREERDPTFGTLPDLAVRAIKGLYGWPPDDIIGTDELVWGSVAEFDVRRRCIQIATSRLEGEGRTYQGRLFRRTLQSVIAEQTGDETPASAGAGRGLAKYERLGVDVG